MYLILFLISLSQSQIRILYEYTHISIYIFIYQKSIYFYEIQEYTWVVDVTARVLIHYKKKEKHFLIQNK